MARPWLSTSQGPTPAVLKTVTPVAACWGLCSEYRALSETAVTGVLPGIDVHGYGLAGIGTSCGPETHRPGTPRSIMVCTTLADEADQDRRSAWFTGMSAASTRGSSG